MAKKPYKWSGSKTDRLMLRMLNLEHLAEPETATQLIPVDEPDKDPRPATNSNCDRTDKET